jgi:hypothetical protein
MPQFHISTSDSSEELTIDCYSTWSDESNYLYNNFYDRTLSDYAFSEHTVVYGA